MSKPSNNFKHGEEVNGRPSVELRIYRKMKDRCFYTKCKDYVNYGARGIKVCDRWLGPLGVVNFIKDMGRRPGPEYSIERIDVNGDYCPEN